MPTACVSVLVALRSASDYIVPPTIRIVQGRPENVVEEILSDAVREALRRLIKMSDLMEGEANK